MYRIPDQRGGVVPVSIVCLLITVLGVCSLKIDKLSVPSFVQLDSNESITLDCDYSYLDKEKQGMVVKWYREHGKPGNKSTQQVYQWIIQHQPQSLGILKGRLDTTYEASDDPYSKFRALRIVKPSLNLSGEYKCHVSSNFEDDEKTQSMLIYSPAKDLSIEASPSAQKVNVSCKADGVYPKPVAELSITRGSKKTRSPVDNTVQSVTLNNNGLYSIIIYKEFEQTRLSAETVFDCTVSVPDTKYSAHKSYTYHPGEPIDLDGKGTQSAHHAESETNSKTNRTPDSGINEPSYGGRAETTAPSLTMTFLVIVKCVCLFLV